MKAASFEFHAPQTTDEAVATLHEHVDDAKILAGGQSLVPMLALRLTRFEHLIDLNRIPALQYINREDDGLSIGAITRQATAEHSPLVRAVTPLLARALPHIGHFQIRNRGTIGGSIAHADPASELPAVAVTLDAEIEVQSHSGTRRIPAEEFFVSFWETAMSPDEIVVAIRIPDWGARSGFGFEEFALRLGDFAIAGAACALHLDRGGLIDRARVTLMGMGPTPVFARAAGEALVGRNAAEIDLDAVAGLAVDATEPDGDVHASAAYRRTIATLMVKRSVATAREEAQGE